MGKKTTEYPLVEYHISCRVPPPRLFAALDVHYYHCF